jgi:hypothetical protein
MSSKIASKKSTVCKAPMLSCGISPGEPTGTQECSEDRRGSTPSFPEIAPAAARTQRAAVGKKGKQWPKPICT